MRSCSNISRSLSRFIIIKSKVNRYIYLPKSSEELIGIRQRVGRVNTIHNQCTNTTRVHVRNKLVHFCNITLTHIFWLVSIESFAAQQFIDGQHNGLCILIIKSTNNNCFAARFFDFGRNLINSFVNIRRSTTNVTAIQFAIQFGKGNFLLGRRHWVSLVRIRTGQRHISLQLHVPGHFTIFWNTSFGIT